MNLRNKNRPGYKQTKIGWIPDEWECNAFKSIVKISQYGLSKSISVNGNSQIVGMANLQNGRITFTKTSKVYLTNKEKEDYCLKQDDIIFNRTNSEALVGKTALVEVDSEYVFASYLVRFNLIKAKSFPLFITQYYNMNSAIQRLRALATPGVSQFNINPTTLKRHFYVPLPPLPEQKKIAAILSTWDKAIEQTSTLINAKLQLKKGLMQQLLTGRKRFPEFGKPTLTGELPEGWREVKLSEVL
ncbi:MAG: restriction endonuclease subunit S, partial [Candidatus Cloacimonetes bacterium]|nr:restriction endonuclease subunit S [Candidatus Cloacimonadota bacterium]